MSQNKTEQFSTLERVLAVQDKYQKQVKQRAKLMREVLKDLGSLAESDQLALLRSIGNDFPVTELSETFVKQASMRGVELGSAASFRAQMAISTRRRQLHSNRIETGLNDKQKGYRFADAIELRRPKTLVKKTSCSELVLLPRSVIKPTSGSSSIGIFAVHDDTHIVEIRTGQVLTSLEALQAAMQALLKQGAVKRDVWMVEELVGGRSAVGEHTLASDLKFYAFYGQIGVVLEVERGSQTRYCEWLADGTRAATGRYAGKTFEGQGFSSEQLEQAVDTSLKIPSAFIRIDFLRTNEDFVLGEFTPRPGQFHTFDASFDRYLGEKYLAAEARLQEDLLQGKEFSAFKKVVKLNG